MCTQSFAAMMPHEMMELHTRPLFAFQAAVAKPNIIGMTPGHDRRVGVVTGGSRAVAIGNHYAAMRRSPSTFVGNR
jgi:hypothetical protein